MGTPWDISGGVYASKSLLVSGQATKPLGVAFSSDGTKCYLADDTTNTIYQYALSVAWDLSTGVYASKSLLISGQDGQPYGVAFSSDGTKCYLMGYQNKTIYQYALSVAWDVSSGVYASKSLLTSGQDTVPFGVAFSSDGTKCYMMGYGTKTIYQYALSVAWDVSSGVYASKSLLISGQATQPYGPAFSSDGTKCYLTDNATDTIYQYALSVAWDVSSGVYASKSLLISGQATVPFGVAFSSDGTKCYITGYGNKTIYQYTLAPPPTASTPLGGVAHTITVGHAVGIVASSKALNPATVTHPIGTVASIKALAGVAHPTTIGHPQAALTVGPVGLAGQPHTVGVTHPVGVAAAGPVALSGQPHTVGVTHPVGIVVDLVALTGVAHTLTISHPVGAVAAGPVGVVGQAYTITVTYPVGTAAAGTVAVTGTAHPVAVGHPAGTVAAIKAFAGQAHAATITHPVGLLATGTTALAGQAHPVATTHPVATLTAGPVSGHGDTSHRDGRVDQSPGRGRTSNDDRPSASCLVARACRCRWHHACRRDDTSSRGSRVDGHGVNRRQSYSDSQSRRRTAPRHLYVGRGALHDCDRPSGCSDYCHQLSR